MKKIDYIPLVAVALVALGLIAASYFVETTPISIEARTIGVTVDVENRPEHRVALKAGATVLSALQSIHAEHEELMLETRTYEGLGTLVTSMYGFKNGTNNNYWQYEVNGVMPQVGADKYVLKDGDFVEWKFETSEY